MTRDIFPLGFLPIVGVVTVGGWVCTGVDAKHATFTRCSYWRGLYHSGGSTVVRLADGGTRQGWKTNPVDVGELLPIFDPEGQPGTWAVLLREFARELRGAALPGGTSVQWTRSVFPSGHQWCLFANTCAGPQYTAHYLLSELEPGPALQAAWRQHRRTVAPVAAQVPP